MTPMLLLPSKHLHIYNDTSIMTNSIPSNSGSETICYCSSYFICRKSSTQILLYSTIAISTFLLKSLNLHDLLHHKSSYLQILLPQIFIYSDHCKEVVFHKFPEAQGSASHLDSKKPQTTLTLCIGQ